MTQRELYNTTQNWRRGFANMNEELQKEWIDRNLSTLQMFSNDESAYPQLAEALYNVLLWQNDHQDLLEKGYKPTKKDIKNYVLQNNQQLDWELRHIPAEKDETLFPEEKGYTQLQWDIYQSLDEQGKKEFKNVRTQSELEKDAESMHSKQLWFTALENYTNPAFGLGSIIGSVLSPFGKESRKKESLAFRQQDNDALADEIHSNYLERYLQTLEFKDREQKMQNVVADLFNSIENSDERDKYVNDLFNQIARYNPQTGEGNRYLTGASGTDLSSENFTEDTFDSYLRLMTENPDFKKDYIAKYLTLMNEVKEGNMGEDDARKALELYAANSLKEKESFGDKTKNAFSGLWALATTYTALKGALFVNAYNASLGGARVFMDNSGKIYSNAEIYQNAEPGKGLVSEGWDNLTIYKDKNGNLVNYQKVYTDGDTPYVYMDEKGNVFDEYEALQVMALDENADVQKVPVQEDIAYKNKVGGMDLARLGKDKEGNDINAWYNQKYLSMALKYNENFLNRDKLDYWDKYGMSKYTNIVAPGEDGRDFVAETIRMVGFALSDYAPTVLMGLGRLVGVSAKVIAAIEGMQGLTSAFAIGDSYALGNFEESLMKNNENLYLYFQLKALEDTDQWFLSELALVNFNARLNQKVAEALSELNRHLTPDERALIQKQTEDEFKSEYARSLYDQLINSEEFKQKQGQAISDAGNAAMVDYIGEAMKYGVVNLTGFRSWMFKSRTPLERALTKGEEGLFGKGLSRVGKATAEDVLKGLAQKEGDLFLKEAWSNMTKKQKAYKVLEATGKQLWGGAWTNWTDEMQSAGAKALNDYAFQEHLNGGGMDGYYLANLIEAHTRAALHSATDKNSLWAGLVGGVGSVFGFGINVPLALQLAMDSQARQQLRKDWNNAGKGKKAFVLANTLLNNGILTEYNNARLSDLQALEILEHNNKLNESIGNAPSLPSLLFTLGMISNSRDVVDSEENNTYHILNLLRTAKAFSETNPGIADLDYNKNMQEYLQVADDLQHFEDLTPTLQKDYLDEIKALGHLTDSQALEELQNVVDRAKRFTKLQTKLTELENKDEYKRALKKGDKDKLTQLDHANMLEIVSDFLLEDINRRELKITGKDYNSVKDESLNTYGHTAKALENTKVAYDMAVLEIHEKVQNVRDVIETAKIEEKIERAERDLQNATDENDKRNLQNQLLALKERKRYNDTFLRNLLNLEDDLLALKEAFEEKAKNFDQKEVLILKADEILNLHPIDRMRILNPNNRLNYTKQLQKEIDLVIATLNLKGLNIYDIVDLASALSRMEQRKAILNDFYANSDARLNLEFLDNVRSEMQAALNIQYTLALNVTKSNLLKLLKGQQVAIGLGNPIYVNNPIDYLKLYTPLALQFFKDKLPKKYHPYINEAMDISIAANRARDLALNIYELFGTDVNGNDRELDKNEHNQLLSRLELAHTSAKSSQEFYDNLATLALHSMVMDKFYQRLKAVNETFDAIAMETAELEALRKEALALQQLAQQLLQQPTSTPLQQQPAPLQLPQQPTSLAQPLQLPLQLPQLLPQQLPLLLPLTLPQLAPLQAPLLPLQQPAQSQQQAPEPQLTNQDAIDLANEAKDRINLAYPNVFTEEELNGIRDKIQDIIENNKPFNELVNHLQLENLGEKILNNGGLQAFNSIIKDIKEKATEEEKIPEGFVKLPLASSIPLETPLEETADNGTINGNSMQPFKYQSEDNKDVLELKYEEGDGQSMDLFYKWLNARGINLPVITDGELADILATGTLDNPVKIRFLRVNNRPNPAHNEWMQKHTLLAVKYTDAVKAVHNEELGKPFRANGEEWLPIGTMGYFPSNTAQEERMKRIRNAVRNNALNYFIANPNEEFFVDLSMYSLVATTHSGYMITRMPGQPTLRYRTIGELLADKASNPLGYELSDLKWGIQTYTHDMITNADKEYQSPLDIAANAGNVFLLIKGGDKYMCAMIKPVRYTEIREGLLKSEIYNALRGVTAPDYNNRKASLSALRGMVVLQKKGEDKNVGIDIVVGNENLNVVTIRINGQNNVFPIDVLFDFDRFRQVFERANPRININATHISDANKLRLLDEAGALLTDVASLIKRRTNFTIYNVGADGKPIIALQTLTARPILEGDMQRGLVKKIPMNGKFYTNRNNVWLDEDGKTVTDATEKLSLDLNKWVLDTGLLPSIKIGKFDFFILNNNQIIAIEENTHKALYVNDNLRQRVLDAYLEQLNKTEAWQRAELARQALQGQLPIKPETPAPKVDTATPPITYRDFLNPTDDTTSLPNSTPEEPVVNGDPNLISDKPLNPLQDSDKSSNFAKSAEEILQGPDSIEVFEVMKAEWPEVENMDKISDLVLFLKDKGKQTENIQDIKGWIDNFKCNNK